MFGVCGLFWAATRGSAAPHNERPKIALALSGGGAYGFAEVGAMEWLEEHRIPIDCIAGTSGGALVGGWYATGLDLLTDEEVAHPPPHRSDADMRMHGMAEALERLDLPSMFASVAPYREMPFDVKRDRLAFPYDGYWGVVDDSLRAPDGLIAGQGVGLVLDRIALRYPTDYLYADSNQAPFDRLPTPFRAVAVDFRGPDYHLWEKVVIGGHRYLPRAPGYKISLPEAMRASMAIPVVFAPVYVPPLAHAGSHASYNLFDGGIDDNFPTDVAIDEFQPQVLIGLRFQVDLEPLSMLLRATGHAPLPAALEKISDNYKPGRRGKQPQVSMVVNLSTGVLQPHQFDYWRQLSFMGYRSMERYYETTGKKELDSLSLSLPDYLAYRRARRARISTFPVVPAKAVADRSLEVGAAGLNRIVDGKSLEDPAVQHRLDEALTSNQAKGLTGTLGYTLAQRDGQTVLDTVSSPRAFGPPYLYAEPWFDFQSGDRFWGGVNARLWKPDTPFKDMSWRTDVGAGNDIVAGTRVDWNPWGGRFFLEPYASYLSAPQFMFDGRSRVGEVDFRDDQTGLSLGLHPNNFTELRASGVTGRVEAGAGYGDPTGADSGSYRQLDLFGALDTTNSVTNPTSGWRMNGELRQLYDFPGSADKVTQATASAELFSPTQHGDSPIFARLAAGTSFGANAPFLASYRLGGYGMMSGYGADEIRDSGFRYEQVGYWRRITSVPYYLGSLYLGGWIENATAQNRSWNDAVLGLEVDSRLGPLFLGASMADHGGVGLLLELGVGGLAPRQGFDFGYNPWR